ncbi:MAG TPA: DUF4406 domain-containing protein [bacterium]|nr:DUF4406 domain-containing protein [bacterium]
MKVVYISGPYRNKTIDGIYENIQRARVVAKKYWATCNYAVICPHLNTAMMDGIVPEQIWLKGDIEILKRCDIIVMMKGWETSAGACDEHAHANNRNLEIIYE